MRGRGAVAMVFLACGDFLYRRTIPSFLRALQTIATGKLMQRLHVDFYVASLLALNVDDDVQVQASPRDPQHSRGVLLAYWLLAPMWVQELHQCLLSENNSMDNHRIPSSYCHYDSHLTYCCLLAYQTAGICAAPVSHVIRFCPSQMFHALQSISTTFIDCNS